MRTGEEGEKLESHSIIQSIAIDSEKIKLGEMNFGIKKYFEFLKKQDINLNLV